MEQCRQGKSAKRIRNFGKRIGSEGWARGSRPRTRRLSADCSSCSCGESGSPRAGRGTDRERPPREPSPSVEQPTQNWLAHCSPLARAAKNGRFCPVFGPFLHAATTVVSGAKCQPQHPGGIGLDGAFV
ncbi:hypothetical protein C4D60_Mb10t26920 [Musa balbisiana]|uniref:Uncharacterized protein n=1 Tax=Musa balbisiana TaxID=52838 RepID=A0A4S8J029_MUSBA|nr:hypothetical protein C4D60_Mb10t26920 [Musa balbisiana]